MIEKINEQNIWDFLKNDNKPVVLYGMGNGAEKIADTLKKYNIEISDIFASDEFVRGHSFLSHKVLKYSEVCQKYDNFNVVLSFASRLLNVLNHIKEIDNEHSVFAPDVPVVGDGLFTREFIELHDKEFDLVYNKLEDEESKKTYLDILNFKVSGKVKYLYNSFCNKDDVYKKILKLNENETIVDLGAYDGDTIREFAVATGNKWEKIIALEPDPKNFKKLEKNTASCKGVSLYNIGAWDKQDTLIFAKKAGRNSRLSGDGIPIKVTDIDSLLSDEKITMIKMDIEGSEMKALDGAKSIIKKHSPKLYVCAYHRNEDLYALPIKILDINDNYKIYFRHSVYIPAWESNFYCITD